MHRSTKPVRKCHGCGLNLGDVCGVFTDPRQAWDQHRACPGYLNDRMLADYRQQETIKAADARKEKRREVAKVRRAAVHQNGDRHVLIAVQR